MNYQDYLKKKQNQYGDKFDSSDLADKFIPYFNSQKRFKVKMHIGNKIKSGYLGVTTGWKPVFMLMENKLSIDSSDLLSDKDEIIP